ncbi:MAG: hypothetical protein KJ725_20730 [Gammaproteobacteria bacterium]|jgi:hypothetical protein|uniref:type II toxin-antitoxin system VapB15 family antitoxin n=1 Tax=Methylotuvimicrobium sp. TaxID=2822413 RepID=UPI000F64820E|nr:hypothetical protein [Gammaproteobacteria bacterium]
MSISVSIDFTQLKNAIEQCDVSEKMELFRLLENETFPNRFKQFLARVKTDELTLDEITAEVEAVRQANFDARNN